MPDAWSVLGLDPGAGLDEARRAYLVRLQLLHPDHHQGAGPLVLAEAERATRELTTAWEEVQRLLGPPPSPPSRGPAGRGRPGAGPSGSARSGAAASGSGVPAAPPAGVDACLRWAVDRLMAVADATGDPLAGGEVDLLLHAGADAPGGRRMARWLVRRRATLSRAIADDGADAWSRVVRTLQDGGSGAVLLRLFEQR